MSLPAIDIPFKLPFDVPLHIHPIFVHFAIAIPVLVLLIELLNLKAKNRGVSLVSLFLLTLAMIVYVGAYYTGKADGSHAFALLTSDAKEELKFHKLLGTYLVYGTIVLFVLKLLALMIKQSNWARDIFLVALLIFIGAAFKQGKEGGELVYEYGVSVEPVNKLQDRIDDMEYDIADLKEALKKAKEAASATSQTPQSNAPQSATTPQEHTAAPHAAPEAGTPSSSKEETHPSSESSAAPSEEATPAAASHEPASDTATEHAEEANDTTPVAIPTH